MADSESKKPRSTDEPDTYELDLDDSDRPASTPPASSGRRSQTPKRAEADDDIYDLAESEPAPRKQGEKEPSALDPRLDSEAVPPAPAGEAPPPDAAADTKVPKQYQTEPEPAYLDPAVAASKREQARIRAAEQMAIEEEKKRKVRLIIAGVIVLLALLAWVWWYIAS